jgi:hypothetical protein
MQAPTKRLDCLSRVPQNAGCRQSEERDEDDASSTASDEPYELEVHSDQSATDLHADKGLSFEDLVTQLQSLQRAHDTKSVANSLHRNEHHPGAFATEGMLQLILYLQGPPYLRAGSGNVWSVQVHIYILT